MLEYREKEVAVSSEKDGAPKRLKTNITVVGVISAKRTEILYFPPFICFFAINRQLASSTVLYLF